METLLTVVRHAVILFLMAPVVLVLAWPFLIAAVLAYRLSATWLDDKQRLLLACGVAALGIAPAFDDYRFPKPIYLHWWDGDSVGWGATILSLLLTWLLCWLQARTLMGRRHDITNA